MKNASLDSFMLQSVPCFVLSINMLDISVGQQENILTLMYITIIFLLFIIIIIIIMIIIIIIVTYISLFIGDMRCGWNPDVQLIHSTMYLQPKRKTNPYTVLL